MKYMMQVIGVNRSEKKGTIKTPVEQLQLTNLGVEGDAHAGRWNRQVSLLARESIDRFSAEAGRNIAYGEFAENITTEGINLWELHPLDLLVNDQVRLEVTQIGKVCHGTNCQIFREVGNCVMPKEGIFARVLKTGTLRPDDGLEVIRRELRIGVITLSDRAYDGVYADRSGPWIIKDLEQHFRAIGRPVHTAYHLLPDDESALTLTCNQLLEEKYDLIITTGGTGIGPRDITPDVIRRLIDKEIPGIMDMIRIKYGADKPAALLSRSVAGVSGSTQLYCLPGSLKAVREYMTEIKPLLLHSLYMLHGLDLH